MSGALARSSVAVRSRPTLRCRGRAAARPSGAANMSGGPTLPRAMAERLTGANPNVSPNCLETPRLAAKCRRKVRRLFSKPCPLIPNVFPATFGSRTEPFERLSPEFRRVAGGARLPTPRVCTLYATSCARGRPRPRSPHPAATRGRTRYRPQAHRGPQRSVPGSCAAPRHRRCRASLAERRQWKNWVGSTASCECGEDENGRAERAHTRSLPRVVADARRITPLPRPGQVQDVALGPLHRRHRAPALRAWQRIRPRLDEDGDVQVARFYQRSSR